MNSFLSVCALVGATLIVSRGTVFRWLQRLWPPLFQCSQCVGTWVGIVAGTSGVVQVGHGRLVDAVLVGAATSFLSMAADAVFLKLLGDPHE